MCLHRFGAVTRGSAGGALDHEPGPVPLDERDVLDQPADGELADALVDGFAPS